MNCEELYFRNDCYYEGYQTYAAFWPANNGTVKPLHILTAYQGYFVDSSKSFMHIIESALSVAMTEMCFHNCILFNCAFNFEINFMMNFLFKQHGKFLSFYD